MFKTVFKLLFVIPLWFAVSLSSAVAFEVEVFAPSGHVAEVTAVAVSPDGRYVLSGSNDKTLKLWEISSGKEISTFTGHSGSVSSVAFSYDGRFAVSTGHGDKTVRLWDVSAGKEIKMLVMPVQVADSAVFSRDGRYIISGGGIEEGVDLAHATFPVILWETFSGRNAGTFRGNQSTITFIAISPNGKYILIPGNWVDTSQTLQIIDLSTGRAIKTLRGHSGAVTTAAISPDGKYVVSGGDDGTLKLWNFSSGREKNTFKGHTGVVNSVVFSPDGEYILSGSKDNTLKLWNANSGREIRTLKGHARSVDAVAFLPDGKHAVSGSADKTVKLWDVNTGVEISRFLAEQEGQRTGRNQLTVQAIQGAWAPVEGFHHSYCAIDFYVTGSRIEAGVYTNISRCLGGPGAKTCRDGGKGYKRIPVAFDGEYLSFSYNITIGNWGCQSQGLREWRNSISFKLKVVSENLLSGTMPSDDGPGKKVEFHKRSSQPGVI